MLQMHAAAAGAGGRPLLVGYLKLADEVGFACRRMSKQKSSRKQLQNGFPLLALPWAGAL
jgi:hypothetical protein